MSGTGPDGAPGKQIDAIVAIVREAQDRWPGVVVDAARFAERLAECAPVDGAGGDGVVPHATDLYLAMACATGHPRALQLFDDSFLVKVSAFVARVDRSPAFADEVRQRLRDTLLVPKTGRAGIAAYAGRGALVSWVHVAALRTALNLQRSEGDVRESPEGEAVWGDAHPELGYIRERYRDDFRVAFQEALASLAAPARRLLRMHFVDGMSLRQIGIIEKLDKSNISRRLAQTRADVLAGTRARLRERLQIGDSDLNSLLDAMGSQLDVSIERFLGRSHDQ